MVDMSQCCWVFVHILICPVTKAGICDKIKERGLYVITEAWYSPLWPLFTKLAFFKVVYHVWYTFLSYNQMQIWLVSIFVCLGLPVLQAKPSAVELCKAMTSEIINLPAREKKTTFISKLMIWNGLWSYISSLTWFMSLCFVAQILSSVT